MLSIHFQVPSLLVFNCSFKTDVCIQFIFVTLLKNSLLLYFFHAAYTINKIFSVLIVYCALIGLNQITIVSLYYRRDTKYTSVQQSIQQIEQVYSNVRNIQQNRRNRTTVGSLKDQFFLAVLQLPERDNFGYSKEIKGHF